jgi:tetratricopeptide (TPR) repeat protein
MRQSRQRLQHLPFFEVLADTEEGSDQWRSVSAGLVTLRLVDDWIRFGMDIVAPSQRGVQAVREMITAVSTRTTVRTILTSIVDSMETATQVDAARVLPRLLAYAHALQFDAHWRLAVDVYRTVVLYADPVTDSDMVIAANMQMGSCYRTLGDFRDAGNAFRAAGELAEATNDIMNVLRSRIQEAKLAIDRGNLPRAEFILDETIRRAKERGLDRVGATALHDRSHVAVRRGNFAEAVRLAYEALGGTQDPAARDRILGDIAASLSKLGLRSAARDAYLIMAATAQEQYVRWTATISLMEIAALDEREPVFERYRRDLEDEKLPPNLAAYYHYYVGAGQQLFSRFDQAREALRRSIQISSAHELDQLALEAENRLRAVELGEAAQRREQPQDTPAEVSEVTRAIRTMREMAGVGE